MKTAGVLVGVSGAVVLYLALKGHTIETTLTAIAGPGASGKPGRGAWVGVVNQPPVYLIDANGNARHVPDFETMQSLSGTKDAATAAALVHWLSPSDFTYPIGAEIPSILNPSANDGPISTDYFGNPVAVGPLFFSSPAGITILPGTAGNYFSAAQLAGNPWGLTASSPISDSQFAQLNYHPPAAAAIVPVAAVVPTPAPLRPAPPAAPAPQITKLGNNDPSFNSWLASEISTLIGPATSKAPFRQQDIDFIHGAIVNRRIPDYYKNSPGDCGAPPQLGSLGLVQEAGAIGGLGVSGAQIGAAIAGTAIKALPVVGAAIGIFEAAYSLAFSHHAAAVKVEQATLCNAVPLANQYMEQLDAAYRNGQISSAGVDQNLDALQAKFLQLVATIIKPNPFSPATALSSHTCNAACVYARCLVGIIDAKKRFDY